MRTLAFVTCIWLAQSPLPTNPSSLSSTGRPSPAGKGTRTSSASKTGPSSWQPDIQRRAQRVPLHDKTLPDFEVRLKFKLLGKDVNGGVQFRSDRVPKSNEMIGYQPIWASTTGAACTTNGGTSCSRADEGATAKADAPQRLERLCDPG